MNLAPQAEGQRRIAVVLFNLGGPDSPAAVRPFLFNLFRDPAIIGAPGPIRPVLAGLISTLRAKAARANYAIMGGASPLLPGTQAQAAALEAQLGDRLKGAVVQCFVAMRYWRPFTEEVAKAVDAFKPTNIVLLPLYPQYSTTTTQSSVKAWKAGYRGPGKLTSICCYPTAAGLIDAHAEQIQAVFTKAGRPANTRLLFSAHGLPQSVLARGDPYQAQIEATAAAVAARLGAGWDWRISYQSRVGPMKWLGPSTLEEIDAAAAQGLGLLITPIAFVSEHIETLVELDHEYANHAAAAGCPHYLRASALGLNVRFIDGLAEAVIAALQRGGVASAGDWRCPKTFSACPYGDAA